MKANLDKMIKDAKDEVPESGEYRRLNRAMLKERMANLAPRRRRRHRVLLGALSLVFLMLFSGQLNQLGSDDFEMAREDWVSLLGKTIPVMKNEFRGSTFTVPEGFSPDDLDELNRSILAGEGELLWVQGTSYGGKTNWVKYVNRVINGKLQGSGADLVDRPDVEPDNYVEFLKKYVREIVEMTDSTPPQRETVMTFDGVVCNVEIWVFHFPEFGEVIRYIGTPVHKNSP
jgi:hypothetical protein